MTQSPIIHPPKVVRTIDQLRDKVSTWKKAGDTIGLVPTMGALHHGHLSLVDHIATTCSRVIVSIFVNPTQFGEGEDLDHYPRQEAADIQALSNTDCDIIFAPTASEIYPDGFQTTVQLSGLTQDFEGKNRPGHFDGVATVVTKLLMISDCDVAIFGEKDYQQLAVIKQFVKDLNIPVKILGGPIAREKDGLAASSRNVYLTEPERYIAAQLNCVLKDCIQKIQHGQSVDVALKEATQSLLDHGFNGVDYLAIVDAETLIPQEDYTPDGRPTRLLAVARIRDIRLLDNLAV